MNDDLISRDAVLDACSQSINILDAMSRIEDLPSVTPKQRTGHWMIIDDCERFIAKCSECGRIEDSRMINKYPYCHCGAKMESEDKE